MKISRARGVIYACWGSTFVLMILMLELAPTARERGAIDPGDAHAGLMKMTSLFVPVMSAFLAFWYRSGPLKPAEGTVKRTLTLSRERWLPAIFTTVAYLVLLLALLLKVTFLEEYVKREPDISFNDGVSNVLQVGLLLSPLVTLPIAFLLGVERLDIPKPI